MKNDKKLANFLRESAGVFPEEGRIEMLRLADIIGEGNPRREEIRLGMKLLFAAEEGSRLGGEKWRQEMGAVYRRIQDEFEAGRG